MFWTTVKFSMQFTADRLLTPHQDNLGNHDIHVTPVNHRTALGVFVENNSMSNMSFRDNMNNSLLVYMAVYLLSGALHSVTWRNATSRYTDFHKYLSYVIRWYLGTKCFKRILIYDKTVSSRNQCLALLCNKRLLLLFSFCYALFVLLCFVA